MVGAKDLRRARGLDRVSPLDVSNLRVEDRGFPMHLAALAILDGTPLRRASGELRLEAIRERVEERTHLAPRLRQALRPVRRGRGPSVWVDDPGFDIRAHVRTHALPGPGDEAALLKMCAELNEPPLDRSRPLWEMWLLTGGTDGTVGLLIRLHHVVADGIATLSLLGALFDAAPESPTPRASNPAEAGTMPSGRVLFADNLRRQAAAVRHSVSQLRRPPVVARRLLSRMRQVRTLARLGSAPAVSLNRAVSEHRRLVLVRADLSRVKAVGRAHDAKVNDVVLSAVAGGARRLLESRGELEPGMALRVSVAASVRAEDDPTTGNRVGVRLVPIPVDEPDARRRLEQIGRATAAQRNQPPYLPGGRLLQRWMVRVMFRQRLVNLLLSNVPGPSLPMYFAGARVLEVFQIGVVQGNITLSVGVLSYAGQLNFDIVADAEAVPDVAAFTQGLSDALAQLGVLDPRGRERSASSESGPR